MSAEGSAKKNKSSIGPIPMGTKAEVLARLYQTKNSFSVPNLLFFTAGSWLSDRNKQLAAISHHFGDGLVAVRSSSLREDGASSSMAGMFHSELNIPSNNEEEIGLAVDRVVESFDGESEDQVLIQKMVLDVAVAGVIMTRDMEQGGPFYVINYDDDSGRTDAITGGFHGVHKTVRVLRSCELRHIKSSRLRAMIFFVRELEALFDSVPLDIEFAIDKTGSIHLLQVRRITVGDDWDPDIESQVHDALQVVANFVKERSQPPLGLAGSKTILGNMPDWNPAEILGVTPRPLAVSLYREIITRDIWRRARERMGYRAVPPQDLMVTLAGRPYIDVRCSLNSFLPAGVENSLAETLVEFWLERLDQYPIFHDKIEFDIATTAIDFNFEETVRERYSSILSPADQKQFRDRLTELTIGCLDSTRPGGLKRAEVEISTLSAWQEKYVEQEASHPMGALFMVESLIDTCRTLGTLPFSVLARHGFIAESLVRSAVKRGALSPDRERQFRESIKTITGHFSADMEAVYNGTMSETKFMARYGHLRPGTYDILSLRYQSRNSLFSGNSPQKSKPVSEDFVISSKERQEINKLLSESRLDVIDADGLFDYAERAIRGREYGKFVFSWNLSEILEVLASWGEDHSLDRETLSCIPLPTIMSTLTSPVIGDSTAYFNEVSAERRSEWSRGRSLNLSYLLRGVHDIFIAPVHRSAPNFVTNETVDGVVALVGPHDPFSLDLTDRIICIENADPGFDWIFTKNIKGLITKFGGVNSHMSIRCVELRLPAAIGCGEMLFDEIVEKGSVELNCAGHVLRAVHGKG